MTTYFHRYYGFDKLTSYLYLHQGQYDAQAGKVYDESLLNGDARAVQVGRCYKGDGVEALADTNFAYTSYFSSGDTSDVCFGAFFKVNSVAPSGGIGKFWEDSGADRIRIGVTDSGTIITRIVSSEGQQRIETNDSFNDAEWHSFIVVLNSNNSLLELYIDGSIYSNYTVLSNVQTNGPAFTANNQQVRLVGNLGGSSFDGYVFAPFIYDGVLTADEVSQYHNGTFDWERMLRIWSCDEGGGINSFEKNGNEVGTIENADLSLFHHQSGDVPFSFQNKLGYTYDQANDRYIPRNEAQPEQDVQGNTLQFLGKVPYDLIPKNSNCADFSHASHILVPSNFKFVGESAIFRIKVVLKLTNDSNRQNIFDNNYSDAGMRFTFYPSTPPKGFRFRYTDNSGLIFNQSLPYSLNEIVVYEIVGDGSTIKTYVDGVLDQDKNANTTPDAWPVDLHIGARRGDLANKFTGNLYYLLIEDPNNDSNSVEYGFAEAGKTNFIHDRKGNFHETIQSVDVSQFWTKDNGPANNLEFGFDLWKDDSSGEYRYIPLMQDGTSIKGENDTISGYTWVSKHLPAKKFHNRAETVFDTEADNPLHYQLKQATGMAGIHPDNVYPSDQFFKKQLDKAEARKFTGYFTEQTGKRLTKTQNFVQ